MTRGKCICVSIKKKSPRTPLREARASETHFASASETHLTHLTHLTHSPAPLDSEKERASP